MTEVWISLSTVRLTINRVRVWTMMFIHSSGDAPYITFNHYRCTCWGGRRGLKDRTGILGWFLKALFGL